MKNQRFSIKRKLDINNFYNTKGFYSLRNEDYEKSDRFLKVISVIDEYSKKLSEIELLDIGCGTAKFMYFLSHKYLNIHLTGCDISSDAIRYNKKKEKYHDLNFFVHDFNYPIKLKNKFDIIYAGEIIEHLENTDNFFRETNKILRREGILIITTPNLASWLDRCMLMIGWQPFSTEVSYVSRTFGRKNFYELFGIKNSAAAGHLRLFTPRALVDLAEYYRFKFIQHIPYYAHNNIINIIISGLFKNLAEGMIMVFQK